MIITHAAGGVILDEHGLVVVVNQKGNSWSLPKGHLEAGEDALTAAVREITEETGLTKLTLVKELGSYSRYRIGKGGKGEDVSMQKHLTFFLFTTNETDLRPQDPDNPEAKWVAKEDVEALLTHPKDKEFFRKMLPQL